MKRPKALELPYPWYLTKNEWLAIQKYVEHLTNRLSLGGVNPLYEATNEET
jgi:hypothetical protein